MKKMQLYEQIRRDYFIKKHSIRHIAKAHHIHRREVRNAIASAIPPAPAIPQRDKPKITPSIQQAIRTYLVSDLTAPKKQRHTCHRIYQRLMEEHNYRGAEPSIRKHIAAIRRELLTPKEVFLIQYYSPGKNAEVDWYEAYVCLATIKTKLYFFGIRASYSGKVFHQAFTHTTQQAFLTGHVNAFNYFGGVFETIRYDNLTAAVKKVLRGRRREETEHFILFRSHYLFNSEFCLPGVKGAHEKGGIEGGVGFFRRRYLVPVPTFETLEALNEYLLVCCEKENTRCIHGKTETIGEQWQKEQAHMKPLPKYPFNTDQVHTLRVNDKSLITLHTNYYSVPTDYLMLTVEAHLKPETLNVYHQGSCIAQHPRSYLKHQTLLNIKHYLKAFLHKSGALKQSLALKQARQTNQWPACYDELWDTLKHRMTDTKGTQEFLAILLLHQYHEEQLIQQAIQQALDKGACDKSAIELLLRQHHTTAQRPEPLYDLGHLNAYDAIKPTMDDYDQLLNVRRNQ